MKKLLCGILAISLFASSAIAYGAQLSDKQKSDLAGYEIMVGYEDGELRLDNAATKAEVAKMLCYAGAGSFGQTAEDEVHSKYFLDIPENHWAIKYINSAKGAGILNGDDNGNFNPDASITYSEFIKMLICLLGYEPMAEARGGYAAGYMMVATQLGLTKFLNFKQNDNATRGDVAVMISTALDVPVMMQTSFGTQIEYSIMDGSNGTKLFTLRTLLEEARANIKA